MNAIRLRLIILGLLLSSIIVLSYALVHYPPFLDFYISNIFVPLQRFRSFVLNGTAISIGDFFYLALLLALLSLLVRLFYFLFTIRKNKNELYIDLIRLGTLPAILYLLFLILWGGNYARSPLSGHLNTTQVTWNNEALIRLNEELVSRMNDERPGITLFPPLRYVNKRADAEYREWAGPRTPRLKVKQTTLGYMLNYLGIQGYYNPFSGEAQFNGFIPPFMHPFVISHEMAHQLGIAAEDEANFIAYILCAQSADPAFRYSAYFNLFLYAFSDLKARDSLMAKAIYDRLNDQSREDMNVLRAMQKKYQSVFRRITSSLYDDYLRLHGQQQGISTYNEVTRWVYFWENSHKKKTDLKIRL